MQSTELHREKNFMLETRTEPEAWPCASIATDATLAEKPLAMRPLRLPSREEPGALPGEVPAAVEAEPVDPCVTLMTEVNVAEVDALLSAYGARLVKIEPGREIPGSYWGESEAGLIENDVFVRADTPVHSLLHELSHFICMDPARRAQLVTDAGGDDDEECAVCYLEVLLADEITGFGRARCLADMDEWGYSFREGSAERWFNGDGVAARAWLLERGVVDGAGKPTFQVRG
jgi:hypothetical protein